MRRGRARRRTAGGCCAATRSARCSAHHLLATGHTGTYACSIVSSSLLGKMAAAAGQPFAETLTGFKWIGRVDGLVFGYEEALGYCVDPEHVKDKDGVSALLLLCELAAQPKAQGRGLVDVLDDLALRARAARHRPALGPGHRPRRITAAMERLRGAPPDWSFAITGSAAKAAEEMARVGKWAAQAAARVWSFTRSS